jgi:hypothetical protein
MSGNLNQVEPPALPQATNEYNRPYQDQLNNVHRLFYNRLTNNVNALLSRDGGVYIQNPHAMLMSNQDQTSGGTTVANNLTFNQPVITEGVEVRNSSEIWFEKPGQYLVSFSLQVTNRSNNDQVFEVWAGFNGANYPLSNTRYDIPPRKSSSVWAHIVPAITGIFTVQNPDQDYLTIKWWASSTDVFLEHYAAQTSPTRPEIPSVIMTVNCISRLP